MLNRPIQHRLHDLTPILISGERQRDRKVSGIIQHRGRIIMITSQEKNSQHAAGVMQTAEEHSRAHQARLSQARSQAAVRLEQRLQMRASQANNREE